MNRHNHASFRARCCQITPPFVNNSPRFCCHRLRLQRFTRVGTPLLSMLLKKQGQTRSYSRLEVGRILSDYSTLQYTSIVYSYELVFYKFELCKESFIVEKYPTLRVSPTSKLLQLRIQKHFFQQHATRLAEAIEITRSRPWMSASAT